MPGGLPLGELVVWRGVPDEEDGDGSQANVCYQVLVIARLRPDLEIFSHWPQLFLDFISNLRRRP